MKTATVSNTLVVLAALAIGCGCPSPGTAKTPLEPSFEWDPLGEFASPGTSLTLTELSRTSSERDAVIFFEIKSFGFSTEENLHMWNKRGTEFSRLPASVNDAGLVQLGELDLLAAGDFATGQPLDVALVSATTGKRAHAKWMPFPIEAHGTGGCSISMSLESESGLLWFVRLRGFEPGEDVQITSEYKSETLTSTHEASDRGEIGFPTLFGRGDRGLATLTATGKNCSVSLQYKIGRDAIASR